MARDPMQTRTASESTEQSLEIEKESRRLLHSLSNKILPIVVFADLALARCQDEALQAQLRKIHTAAEQAREILLRLRELHAEEPSQ